jgi:hypothetical protein
MKKITKLALCVTLILLCVGAYFVVSASTTQSVGPAKNMSNITYSIAPKSTNFEGLRSNFITTVTCATPCVVPAGFTQEDLVDFQCGSTGASTCTLVVNSYATTSGGGVADDDRALCLVLDGAIVGSCAYDGYDASDGSFSAVNATNNIGSLAVGNHQAFMLLYSSYGTAVYTFTNQYNVYKP